jgi:hypothetical protein
MHIDSNGVFWMVRVDDDAVEVDFDEAHARLRVSDLPVFDDHDIVNSLTYGIGFPGGMVASGLTLPPIPAVSPVRATVSFDVEWNGVVATAQIHNTGQRFQGSFLSTGATIKWSAEEPGFRFQSEDPPLPSRNLVSVLGREQNGFFFS